MNVDEILSHFQNARRNGRGFMARCPSHEDKKNSLSITPSESGNILMKCMAGCSTKSVIDAVGLTWRDLAAFNVDNRQPDDDPVIARYVYVDEQQSPLFRVCRTRSKQFFQERFEASTGTFFPGMNGARRVVYQLPEVLAGETVFIVEGEKDVDKLTSIGLTATTNPGGAGKWKAEYSGTLKGKQVVILPDNDDPGQKHALAVARAVLSVAQSVKVVSLPDLPPKGDVSDYLDTHTKEDLLALVQSAKPFNDKPAGRTPITVRISDVEREEIHYLLRNRVALRKLTDIHGDPGEGKSFVSQAIAAAVSCGDGLPGDSNREPGNVIIMSAEDGLSDTIRPRLEDLGADLTRIFFLRGLIDEKGQERALSLEDLDVIERAIIEHSAILVIIDPIIAYTAAKDTHKAAEVRSLLAPLSMLADKHSCAIILIRHLTKGTAKAAYRGQGSIDFLAACRSAFLCGCDPEDKDKKVFIHVKSNFGPIMPALNYSITDGRFSWGGESSLTAEQVLAVPSDTTERGKLDEAKDFLQELLANGPLPSPQVEKAARAAGISPITLRRAKDVLGVKAKKNSFGGGWAWELPDRRCSSSPEDAQDSHRRKHDHLGVEMSAFAEKDGWETIG